MQSFEKNRNQKNLSDSKDHKFDDNLPTANSIEEPIKLVSQGRPWKSLPGPQELLKSTKLLCFIGVEVERSTTRRNNRINRIITTEEDSQSLMKTPREKIASRKTFTKLITSCWTILTQ